MPVRRYRSTRAIRALSANEGSEGPSLALGARIRSCVITHGFPQAVSRLRRGRHAFTQSPSIRRLGRIAGCGGKPGPNGPLHFRLQPGDAVLDGEPLRTAPGDDNPRGDPEFPGQVFDFNTLLGHAFSLLDVRSGAMRMPAGRLSASTRAGRRDRLPLPAGVASGGRRRPRTNGTHSGMERWMSTRDTRRPTRSAERDHRAGAPRSGPWGSARCWRACLSTRCWPLAS